MKKIIPILIALLSLAACRKTDSLSVTQQQLNQVCTKTYSSPGISFSETTPSYPVGYVNFRIRAITDILNNYHDTISYVKLFYSDTFVSLPIQSSIYIASDNYIAGGEFSISKQHIDSLTNGRYNMIDTFTHAIFKIYYRNYSGCGTHFSGIDSFDIPVNH